MAPQRLSNYTTLHHGAVFPARNGWTDAGTMSKVIKMISRSTEYSPPPGLMEFGLDRGADATLSWPFSAIIWLSMTDYNNFKRLPLVLVLSPWGSHAHILVGRAFGAA